MSISLTFQTERTTQERLDSIAKSLRRDRDSVINEAISSYLDLYRRQLEEINRGLADIEVGRTHSTAEVRARIAAKMRG